MGELAGRPLADHVRRGAAAGRVRLGGLLGRRPAARGRADLAARPRRPRRACWTWSTRSTGEFGTTVVLVTHDPEVAAQMPRSITIRNGRIGSEGRHGFDFGVVDEDGAVHLPDDLAARFPGGHAGAVRGDRDGVLLRPIDEQGERT